MEQLQLFAENEDIAKFAAAAEQTPPTEPTEQKAKPKRKPLPEHLERIEQVLAIGEGCPDCGGDLSKLGEDITEELEYIPGRFVVNKIIRPRMSCRRCEVISQAPLPLRPIERGRPGPSLLAHVPPLSDASIACRAAGQQICRSPAALSSKPDLCSRKC